MSRGLFLQAFLAFVLVVWAAFAPAQILTWNNAAGGSFHAPGNWTPAGPPGPTNIANFNLNTTTSTVNFTSAVTNTGLTVNGNGNNVTFNLGGTTYTLSSGIQENLAVGGVSGANADLRILNGTVHRLGAGFVGVSGGTGEVFIGGGGTLITTSFLDLGGGASSGTVHVFDGGDLSIGGGSYIGAGGTGIINVNGSGSTFNPAGGVTIAQTGSGSVNILNGASANLASNSTIGNAPGSTGVLQIDGAGSSVVVNQLDIGASGQGRLEIRNQGLLTSSGHIEAAVFAGSVADIQLEGTWNHANGSIFLGGTASLASNSLADLEVGFGGTLNLSGAGNSLKLWSFNSSLQVSSGVVNVPSLDAATGVISLTNGGAINVNGGALTTSGSSLANLSSGFLAVNGGSWNHAGSVALNGPGFLSIDLNSGVTGVVTGEFQVSGSSILTVRDGSVLSAHRVFVGWTSSSSPSVVVSGGVLNIPATGSMLLGNGGHATVSVQNGGRVDTHGAAVTTGASAAGAISTINVKHSNSVMTLGGGILQLGFQSNTTSNVNVTDGGRLDAGLIVAAGNPGAVANINVSGPGAVLDAGLFLALGGTSLSAGGTATALIGPGGTVNAPNLFLWPGGSVQLNGGTLATTNLIRNGGSLAFNAGTIRFAGNLVTDPALTSFLTGGDATLSAGQTLEVAATTTLVSPLKLDGGTLRTGALAGGSLLNLERGTLDITLDDFQIAADGDLGPTVVLGPQQHIAVSRADSVFTIARQGVLMLNGGTFTFGSNVSSGNLGEIHLNSDLSLLKGGDLANNNLITGTGRIEAMVTNSPSGEIRVLDGQHLRFIGGAHINAGTIHVDGGSFDISSLANFGTVDVLNGSLRATSALANGGVISARDSVLRFVGSLLNNNAGTLGLSFGTSDVFGAVTNNFNGKTIVSGNSRATFNGPVTNNAGGELRVSTGSTAVFFAPVTNNGLITGGGSKFFELGGSNLGALSTSGSTTVAQPASVTATHIREVALTVAGRVTISPSGTPAGTSRLGALSISEGGVMDLSDNDLIIENGNLADITAMIASGRLTTTSPTPMTTLGVLLNGTRFTTFSGQSVSADDVLVKYTYFGDANLDGRVSIADYLMVDRATAREQTGWVAGDFDYSGGPADGTDYFLMDQAFLGQGAALSQFPHAATSVVPEPGIVLGAAVAALIGAARRRRRAI